MKRLDHTTLVDLVFDKFVKKGVFDELGSEVEFGSVGRRADVLLELDGCFVYYEVKESINKSSTKKAREQARAFYEHFGLKGNNFVVVSNDGVYRIRSGDLYGR